MMALLAPAIRRCLLWLALVAVFSSVAACSTAASHGTGTTTAQTSTATAASRCPPGCYCAGVPGPSCDLGGARWSNLDGSTATVTCMSTGMQYKVSAHVKGLVAFFPPSGTIASSFSVSVTITPSDLPNSCVALDTLSSADAGDAFSYLICTFPAGKELWGIWRYSGSSSKVLGEGDIPAPAPAADTLTVTTHGAARALNLNGRQVFAFSDAQLATTEGMLLELNNGHGAAPAAATFSDFVYQPLQ